MLNVPRISMSPIAFSLVVTVPVACFLLFLVPERQKINILGIGRDKIQSQYFTVGVTKSRGETDRRSRATTPHPRHGWSLPCACVGCGTSGRLPASPPAPIRSPRGEN